MVLRSVCGDGRSYNRSVYLFYDTMMHENIFHRSPFGRPCHNIKGSCLRDTWSRSLLYTSRCQGHYLFFGLFCSSSVWQLLSESQGDGPSPTLRVLGPCQSLKTSETSHDLIIHSSILVTPRSLVGLLTLYLFHNSELWETGDIYHLSSFGTHIVVVNSPEVADDLFVKRSWNYSDRPRMPMVNEL